MNLRLFVSGILPVVMVVLGGCAAGQSAHLSSISRVHISPVAESSGIRVESGAGHNYYAGGAAGGAAGAATEQLLMAALVPGHVRDAFQLLGVVTARNLPGEFYAQSKAAGLFSGNVAISESASREPTITLNVTQSALGRTTPWSSEGFVMLSAEADLRLQSKVVKRWYVSVRDPEELSRISFERFNADAAYAQQIGQVTAKIVSKELVKKIAADLARAEGR